MILPSHGARAPGRPSHAMLVAALASCAVHLAAAGLVAGWSRSRTLPASVPIAIRWIPSGDVPIEADDPARAAPAQPPQAAPAPVKPPPVAKAVKRARSPERSQAVSSAPPERVGEPAAQAAPATEASAAAGEPPATAALDAHAGSVAEHTAPKLRFAPKPPYPARASRMNIEGSVLVRVLVGRDGGVESAEIAKSSGSSVLDDAALRTVVHDDWRFDPARRGSETVASWLQIPVVYRLE